MMRMIVMFMMRMVVAMKVMFMIGMMMRMVVMIVTMLNLFREDME